MLDTLRSAGSFARELLWVGAERVTGDRRALTAVPATVTDVDAAWLTTALQADLPGVLVTHVEVVGGDSGTSDRVRLAPEYVTAAGFPAPPATVFVKCAPAAVANRAFFNLARLGETEVRFFTDVAPKLDIEMPRVFLAAQEGRAGRCVVVMEDLAARGARFTDASQPLDLAAATAAIDALARLHAAHWEGSGAALPDWVQACRPDPASPLERVATSLGARAGVRRHRDLVPEALARATARIGSAVPALAERWRRPPHTLLHGDAHVGNMYFVDGRAGLLDWQAAQRGPGLRDVAYFLSNSLPTELRRAYERDLLARYLDGLAAAGVHEPPTMADTLERYREHVLYSWIAIAVTAGAATLQHVDIVRSALARVAAAVLDLEALDLVP